MIASAFLSYSVDNTQWTLGGPLKGWRYNATVGKTFDFRGQIKAIVHGAITD